MAQTTQMEIHVPRSFGPSKPWDESYQPEYRPPPIVAPYTVPRQLRFPLTDPLFRVEVEGPLSPDQLRASKIPDSLLWRAWIEYSAENFRCRKVYGVDVREPLTKIGQSIFKPKLETWMITEHADGEGNMDKDWYRYAPYGKGKAHPEGGRMTQRWIADITERLLVYNPTAHVSLLIFEKVPLSVYQDSGYPPQHVFNGFNFNQH